MILALQDYLRSKSKQFPENPPKGRLAVVESILEHKHHQEFLENFSRESGIPLDSVEKTFRAYLREIAADMSYFAFPFWDALLTWVFETIYEGIDVDTASLEKIRAFAGTKPVVFVSNHRSHMDYLILSYIFYHHKIPMPHICAGSNLSFWPLGPIFRKSGGFFIRRSYEGNKLYAAAIQAYIEEMIREKSVLEFFIEGGRSRTGKLLPPKMGVLSAIVQSWLQQASEDILLVPTSITYESILEEKSYLQEQAGASKKKESFRDLFHLQKHLRKRKGKVYLQFGDPVSIKDFLGTPEMKDRKEKVRQLAYEVTYGINKCTVVTPASLVATAILTHEGRASSSTLIEKKIGDYLDYLRFKQCHLSEPLEKYLKSAVHEALRYYEHTHLLQRCDDGKESLYQVKEDQRNLLDYYKNTSIHFFVSIGVLATLLRSSSSSEVPLRKIEEDFVFLQDLFQYEFTFSRRQSLKNHLQKLLKYFEEKSWAKITETHIQISQEARESLKNFSDPLVNFFEGYYTLWRTLQELSPEFGKKRWESKELLEVIRQKGQRLFLREKINHPESYNQFILQNAIWAFRDFGFLKEEKEGRKKKTYYTVINEGTAIGSKLMEWLKKETD